MKFLLVCNQVPPIIDGVGDYVVNLSATLTLLGHDVQIICSDQKEVNLQNNIKIHASITDWNKKGMDQVAELIQFIQPDWLIFNYVPYAFDKKGIPFGLSKGLASWGKRTKLLVIFHEVRIRWEWNNWKSWLIASAQAWIAKQLHQIADMGFTSIEFYQKLLPQPTYLLPIGSTIKPCPIDLQKLETLRTKWLSKVKGPVILTVGIRNIDRLYKAFQLIQKHMPEACLLVCGAGKEFRRLDGVVYTGRLDSEDLYHALYLGDVLVVFDYVSKKGEGGSCNKSGALAAAFSTGKPVVGTKGDMNNHLLQHEHNIWLVDYHSEELIAKDLVDILEDEILNTQLSAGAKNLYDTQLNWTVLANELVHQLNSPSKKSK